MERAAPVLRVAGAILLAAGILHLYVDRVVFDARTFGARAALSLGDARVAAYAAERVADEAIAQRPDLVAYRPLLVGSARAIVSSEAFRAGFRHAAQGAHAALFSEGAERVALSVPDLGVLVRSALAHDPALAARVPPRLRAGVVVQPSGRYAKALMSLVRLGHRFRRNAILSIAGGGILLFLGIALPHDRRLALLRGGASLASVALVLFFLPGLTRTAITVSMARAELRPVVAGVFDAFAGGLKLWALVLAGVGVVLAAAASSFASHVEIEEIARRVWTRLRTPARTSRGELVRAALLTGAGLLAALRPTATLQALMVIAGALLAFEGLRELFMLVPPRLQRMAHQAEQALAEAREEVSRSDGTRTWIRSVLVGLVAVGLIGSAIFFMRSPAAMPKTPEVTDACNGDRALCGRRLDEVVFPTAHNSMSAAEFPGWMFPNQELGTVALLGHGIRGLLFDVHYGTPIGGRVKTDIDDEATSRAKFEKVIGKEAVDAAMRIHARLTGVPTGPRAAYLCHGFCELGGVSFVTMLEGVRDFLVENPGEVLVFVIEDYVTPADIAAAFRDSELERFVYRGPVEPPFPTLREMIDTDQRLVVFAENDASGVPWYHPALESIQETPYTFHTPEEFSCRANRGGTTAPLFLVNHWIETTPTPKPSNAAIVNAHDFLLARARQCQRERGKLPNLLAVDFARTGDVVGVAAEMNGIAPAPLPAPLVAGSELAPNTLSDAERAAGWRLLWDGHTSKGWRGARGKEFPSQGWEMKDGVLSVVETGGAESRAGGDIVTQAAYTAFELKLAFRLTPGANSGVKYYVDTGLNQGEGSAIGLEYQLLDDARHPDAKAGRDGNRTLASLYDLIPAAADKRVRPIGEWNEALIRSDGRHVEHWLNGAKVLEYERGSEAFRKLVARSKYQVWPAFGERPSGPILLQDHGNRVSFRNLKIRDLTP